MMTKIFISLLLVLFTVNAHALSIIYDGFKCTDEAKASIAPAQSRFIVEEDLGNGHYKLSLEGGYPIFNNKICLEPINDTHIDPAHAHELSKIKAVAYFNGSMLVISYGIIRQNNDIAQSTPTLLSDVNLSSTYTLIIDYLPPIQALILTSVTKLDNLFSALHLEERTQSFSLSHVEPLFLLEEVQFVIHD